jgi:hypothetical protein
MRQFILVVIFVLAMSAMVMGQSSTGTKQTYFSSSKQCIVALENGSANFYRPTYFTLHRKLKAGEEIRGLEADGCAHMLTVKGTQYVAQKEGERFIFKNGQVVAREDCGNPTDDLSYPKQVADIPKDIPKDVPKECPKGTTASETPGICILDVPGPTVTVTNTVYLNPCVADIQLDGQTSMGSRLGGGLPQAGISAAGSALGTLLRGGNGRAIIENIAIGVGTQRVEQVFNASENSFMLTIPSLGIKQKLEKGKNLNLANGIKVHWFGDKVAILQDMKGQTFHCAGDGLKAASNLAISTEGGGSDVTEAIKNLPTSGSLHPIRPPVLGFVDGAPVYATSASYVASNEPTMSYTNSSTPGAAASTVKHITPPGQTCLMVEGEWSCYNN